MKFFLPLTLCAVLGCGLMAGLFFAFSVCVMKGLASLPHDKGIAAMQAFNASILNPIFLTAFMGTAAVCVFSLISALLHWNAPGARFVFAGSVFYLVGVLLVTAAFNVPMNQALDAVKPDGDDSARFWAMYLKAWTSWNHVRTIAALAATALFALALYRSEPS